MEKESEPRTPERESASGGPRWTQIVRWLVAIALVFTVGIALVVRVASANQVLTAHPQPSAVGVHPGQTAPDLHFVPVNETSSQDIRLYDLRGHVVVINFWSPTCAPCHDEAPVLAQSSSHYSAQGVVFLGVAFEGSSTDILAFLHTYHIAYACGQDTTSEIAVAYGLVAIPVTVIVDARGVVMQTIQGAVSNPSLDQALQHALGAHT